MTAFDEMDLGPAALQTRSEQSQAGQSQSQGSGVRAPYRDYKRWLDAAPGDMLARRRQEADLLFRRLGITFAVYGEGGDTERLIPFDIVPRILSAKEWKRLRRGLKQRVKALNAFLDDIYHKREILRAGTIPEDLILKNAAYVNHMRDVTIARQTYTHIAGIDLVRTAENEFYVLEDNCRTPSGVSYMLENREAMMRLFPDLFAQVRVAPVGHYPDALLQTLRDSAPPNCDSEPTVALLTPGVYNSAYFEHVFLAEQMGIELVEGGDLTVKDEVVYMRTVGGLKRVDVLYRRLDDDFLDPKVFRKDSMIGVPGIFGAYKAGNITLANAVGTGVHAGASGRAGGEGSAWFGRLRHAGRAEIVAGRDRGLPRQDRCQAGSLYRAADAGAQHLSHLRGIRHRAAPCRPAAFRVDRPDHAGGAWPCARVRWW